MDEVWADYSLVLVLISAAIGAGRMAVAIAPQDSGKNIKLIYKIGKDVSAPKLIFEVQPEFPQSERKHKEKFEGTCLLNLIVDESGTPQEVHITRSLSPDFDANAIKAVEQYRFSPAMREGKPVAVSLNIEVNFKRF